MGLRAGIDVELPSHRLLRRALLGSGRPATWTCRSSSSIRARAARRSSSSACSSSPFVDADTAVATVATPMRTATSPHDRTRQPGAARATTARCRSAGAAPIAVIGPNADDARNLHGDYSIPGARRVARGDGRNCDNIFNIPVARRPRSRPDRAAGRHRAVRAASPLRCRGPLRQGLRRRPATDTGGFAEACRRRRTVTSPWSSSATRPASRTTGPRARHATGRRSTFPACRNSSLAAVVGTGTPVVLVHIGGRPAAAAALHDGGGRAEAWMPGQEAESRSPTRSSGTANPGGKLPLSFPRRAGHVPVYYRQKRSGGRSHWKGDYADAPVAPLYPFGHGLSYTTFHVEPVGPLGRRAWATRSQCRCRSRTAGRRWGRGRAAVRP